MSDFCYLHALPRSASGTSPDMVRRFACLIAFTLAAVPALADNSPSITVAFSPNRGATDTVVRLIDEAKDSIRVAAYSFSSKEIAKALVNAHRRGVDVEAVLDKSNAIAHYSSATFLANEHIPTRIDQKYAIMHNKFLVVDGVTVETGSFNYTWSFANINCLRF